jgi:hypothetical protein
VVKLGIRAAVALVSCSFVACAAVLGFADRTGTWCTQHSHAFCEDFDDPSLLAQNWPSGAPAHLIRSFEDASLPNAARFSILEGGLGSTSDPNVSLGTGYILQALPPDLFASHTKLAVGLEAQLVGYEPGAATFDGSSPFAPVLIITFEEPTGTLVYGGVVLVQQDAGFWAPAGIRLTEPLDAAAEITVGPPCLPPTCPKKLGPGTNILCTCMTLRMTDGGLVATASPGLSVPPLPNLSPSEVLIGLVYAPLGTSVAIDNVTIDYDQDCDPTCGH